MGWMRWAIFFMLLCFFAVQYVFMEGMQFPAIAGLFFTVLIFALFLLSERKHGKGRDFRDIAREAVREKGFRIIRDESIMGTWILEAEMELGKSIRITWKPDSLIFFLISGDIGMDQYTIDFTFGFKVSSPIKIRQKAVPLSWLRGICAKTTDLDETYFLQGGNPAEAGKLGDAEMLALLREFKGIPFEIRIEKRFVMVIISGYYFESAEKLKKFIELDLLIDKKLREVQGA